MLHPWCCSALALQVCTGDSVIRKLPGGPGCPIGSSRHNEACGYRRACVLQQISTIPHKKQLVEDPNHPQFVSLLSKNLQLENPSVSCCRCAHRECPLKSLCRAARGRALHLPTNLLRVGMVFFCSCASETRGNFIISVCHAKTSWLPRELHGQAAEATELQALLLPLFFSVVVVVFTEQVFLIGKVFFFLVVWFLFCGGGFLVFAFFPKSWPMILDLSIWPSPFGNAHCRCL